jgi:hypothetical protein
MPTGWDSYTFFAISPRHLEAVMTRTCQVLVVGSYSGVLEPGRHYIPLQDDFSNLDAVLDQLADYDLTQRIADTAYQEIYLPGKYSTPAFAETVRKVIGARVSPRTLRRAAFPFVATLGRGGSQAANSLRSAATRQPSPARSKRFRRPSPTTRAVAVATAREALMNPAVRDLMVGYVGSRMWREVTPRQVARDVLRLALLTRSAHPGTRHSRSWRLVISEDDDVLVVRSIPASDLPDTTNSHRCDGSSPGRFVWDHSHVGTSLPVSERRPELGSIQIGPGGTYEFSALESLTRRHPETGRRALAWSLR